MISGRRFVVCRLRGSRVLRRVVPAGARRAGRDDRRHRRRRHRRAEAAGRRRQRHRHPRAVRHELRSDDARRRTLFDPEHARRRALHDSGRVCRRRRRGVRAEDRREHQRQPRREQRRQRQRRSDHGRRAGRSDRRQSDPVFASTQNRRGDVGRPRRHREPPDDRRTPRVDHAADAAGQRQLVRRSGQPSQQHHRRRFVLQQLLRSRQPARRAHQRRADLARIHRAGAGERRAVRRAPGQLHRRRHQQRHAQRHQPVQRARSITGCATKDFVGTEARGQTVNPGTFTFRDTGVWGSGPDRPATGCSRSATTRTKKTSGRCTRFAPIPAAKPSAAASRRVLASDLNALSAFLSQNFQYETGPYENLQDLTPAKRYLLRTDFNLTNSNKISFRYNQLDSSIGEQSFDAPRRRASAGRRSRHQRPALRPLELHDSREHQVGHRRMELGGRQQRCRTTSSSGSPPTTRAAATSASCSRSSIFCRVAWPTRRSARSRSRCNNELRYKTFQLQDSFTKFGKRHTLTFGATTQRYQSENVFWSCCPQSNYAYNSLADFYTDANDYLANPNRTTSPVDAAALQGALLERARPREAAAAADRSGTAARTRRTSGGRAET